jgi:peptidylprolyl isomerase
MKYLLLIIAIGFVAVLLVGCGSSGPKLYNTVSTNTGLEYRDLVVGSGRSPVDEDIVQVHCTGWLQSGQVIESTIGGKPIEFAVGSRVVIDGWDQGIRGMKVGGKRRLVIPPQLGYGSAGNPQLRVPGGATLIYDIQLANVRSLNWVTTASGLKYADLSVVAGPTPQNGQRCYVHYTGWLQSNGTKFDENQAPSEPLSFVIGQGNVIPGWDEGVATMTVGSKRRMIIPPDLAYGEAGKGSIPPNATLVFEVELLDVVPEP